MPQIFDVQAADDIDQLIAHAARMNLVGRVELLRAVRAGALNLIELDRSAALPIRAMEKSRRPVLLLIGDDDYASTGPAGWVATSWLLYWARGALVHAIGADVPSYRAAIIMALAYRRFVLVETGTAHADEWAALLARRMPCTALLPSDGAPHPVPLDKRDVQ